MAVRAAGRSRAGPPCSARSRPRRAHVRRGCQGQGYGAGARGSPLMRTDIQAPNPPRQAAVAAALSCPAWVPERSRSSVVCWSATWMDPSLLAAPFGRRARRSPVVAGIWVSGRPRPGSGAWARPDDTPAAPAAALARGRRRGTAIRSYGRGCSEPVAARGSAQRTALPGPAAAGCLRNGGRVGATGRWWPLQADLAQGLSWSRYRWWR